LLCGLLLLRQCGHYPHWHLPRRAVLLLHGGLPSQAGCQHAPSRHVLLWHLLRRSGPLLGLKPVHELSHQVQVS
jgi:hypothetical protein